MKRIIFLLLLFPLYGFTQNAPSYDVRVITEPGDTTYTLELIDLSNPNAEFESVNRKTGLTLGQAQEFLYERYSNTLDKKGSQVASIFITERLQAQLATAISQASGNYATWSQDKFIVQDSIFNGVYRYVDLGTGQNLEITILGGSLINNANQNVIGAITGEISPKSFFVEVGLETIYLSGFDPHRFFGVRNGNVVALVRIGDINLEP